MTLTIDKTIYSQLLGKFQPKIIKTIEEYDEANRILLELMLRTERSPEETELLQLMAMIIQEFDKKQEQPEPASPQEVLLHLMEERNLKQVDLVGKIGSKGVVSEIVNGKRSISKSQAKTLAEIFHVSSSVFI
jgi:HTH-type transcriptional regulator/antitoxin HigA